MKLINLRLSDSSHLLALSILLVTIVFSQNVVAKMFVHQLKHQTAEHVLPVITPHLDSQTKITTKDNTLFIQASEKEYEKIQAMLKMIDKPRGEYMVDVWILNRKLDHYETQSTKVQANNRVFRGKVTRYQTDQSSNNEKRFSLRVSEGYPGFVNAGESFFSNELVNHYGKFIPQTRNHKISSGFYVAINEAGENQVAVKVSAKAQSRSKSNNTNHQGTAVSNTVNGEKGSWILLASINADKSSQQNTAYRTQRQRANKRWYYLRVSDIIK